MTTTISDNQGNTIIPPAQKQAEVLAAEVAIQGKTINDKDSLVINKNPDPKAWQLAHGTKGKPALILPRETITEPVDREMIKEMMDALGKAEKKAQVAISSVFELLLAFMEINKESRQGELIRSLAERVRSLVFYETNKADGAKAASERAKGSIISNSVGIGVGVLQAVGAAVATVKSASPLKESAGIAKEQTKLSLDFEPAQDNLKEAQRVVDGLQARAASATNASPQQLADLQEQVNAAEIGLSKAESAFNQAQIKFDASSKPLGYRMGVLEARVQMARAVNDTVSALSGGGRSGGEIYKAGQDQTAELLQVDIEYRRQLDSTAQGDKQYAEQAAANTLATISDGLATARQIMNAIHATMGELARNSGT